MYIHPLIADMQKTIDTTNWLRLAQRKLELQLAAINNLNQQIPDIQPYEYRKTESEDGAAQTGRSLALHVGKIFVAMHYYATNDQITPSWAKIRHKVHYCLENADPDNFGYLHKFGIAWKCDRNRCKEDLCPHFKPNFTQSLLIQEVAQAHRQGMAELREFTLNNPIYANNFFANTCKITNDNDLLISAIGRLFLITPRIARKSVFKGKEETPQKELDKFIDSKTLIPNENDHATNVRRNIQEFLKIRNSIIHTYDKAGIATLQIHNDTLAWFDNRTETVQTISAESLDDVNDAGVASQQSPQMAVHQHPKHDLRIITDQKLDILPPTLSAQLSINEPFLGIPPFKDIPANIFKTKHLTAIEDALLYIANANLEELAATPHRVADIKEVIYRPI